MECAILASSAVPTALGRNPSHPKSGFLILVSIFLAARRILSQPIFVNRAMAIRKKSTHEFRALDDISAVVETVMRDFPSLGVAELNITELMLNAVEHGNLGIGFDQKSNLLQSGCLLDEIEKRQSEEKYRDRTALMEVTEFDDEIVVMISDEGEGFPWKNFLDAKLADKKGLHGRGVLLARQTCKTLTYVGNGNKVLAVFERNSDILA